MNSAGVVFLDRDGTINQDGHYVCQPEKMILLPGSSSALAKLYRAGYRLVVVSNQSAVARGIGTIEDVERTNAAMVQALLHENSDAVIDQIIYCPHGPDDDCSCRKPKPGMLEQYARDNELDINKCFMVGDKLIDLEVGRNFGIPEANLVLVETGYGAKELERLKKEGRAAPYSCRDLLAASDYILTKSATTPFSD